MSGLLNLPELRSLDHPEGLIRIPFEVDVPLTARVRRLVDSAAFRRLAGVSQLGLVGLVYPGARHSRLEHSLGVYRMALLFLRKLAGDPVFSQRVDRSSAECFLVAALLHDVGHWPFCHPMEDLGLELFPSHEQQAAVWLEGAELRRLLESDWGLAPADVLRLLLKRPADVAGKILCSLLSGPVDIDKMDYLARDSLHCGVPYGRNFDSQRLIGSLCLDESGERLAITAKGKTAAEMMVFARYVMFSEVYWHHAVRSATAMLQRAVYGARACLDTVKLATSTEEGVQAVLRAAASAIAGEGAGSGGIGSGDVHQLLDGLFGPSRQLYKRWWQSGLTENPGLFQQIAHRPYPWLVALAESLAAELSAAAGIAVRPGEVLVDAPPTHLEVQFRVDVRDSRSGRFRPLAGISPVVEALANRQFDDFVKQVRVFLHPTLMARLQEHPSLEQSAGELVSRALVRAGNGRI